MASRRTKRIPGFNFGTDINGPSTPTEPPSGVSDMEWSSQQQSAQQKFARQHPIANLLQGTRAEPWAMAGAQRPRSTQQALSRVSPTAGVAAFAGRAAVRGAFKPSPYTNPDTWMHDRMSLESELQVYGRGAGESGIPTVRTGRSWAHKPQRGQEEQMHRESPGMTNWALSHTHGNTGYAYGVVGEPAMPGWPRGEAPGNSWGNPGAPGSGAGVAPFANPAGSGYAATKEDLLFAGNTSGTGTPWWDAHTMATSGIEAPKVTGITAPQPPSDGS